jgi:hypothetical protein
MARFVKTGVQHEFDVDAVARPLPAAALGAQFGARRGHARGGQRCAKRLGCGVEQGGGESARIERRLEDGREHRDAWRKRLARRHQNALPMAAGLDGDTPARARQRAIVIEHHCGHAPAFVGQRDEVRQRRRERPRESRRVCVAAGPPGVGSPVTRRGRNDFQHDFEDTHLECPSDVRSE